MRAPTENMSRPDRPRTVDKTSSPVQAENGVVSPVGVSEYYNQEERKKRRFPQISQSLNRTCGAGSTSSARARPGHKHLEVLSVSASPNIASALPHQPLDRSCGPLVKLWRFRRSQSAFLDECFALARCNSVRWLHTFLTYYGS